MDRLKRLFPFLLFLFFFSCSDNKSTDGGWDNLEEPDPDSIYDTFTEVVKISKVTVFVFFSIDCPLCQSYIPTLLSLQERYSGEGVHFVAVLSGSDYDRNEIESLNTRYNFKIDKIIDLEFSFANRLNATITPEVFVVDQKGNTLYSGRIDNWAYEVGKKRTVVTEHELEDALKAIVKGEPVKVKHADAVGCFIEKEKNK